MTPLIYSFWMCEHLMCQHANPFQKSFTIIEYFIICKSQTSGIFKGNLMLSYLIIISASWEAGILLSHSEVSVALPTFVVWG